MGIDYVVLSTIAFLMESGKTQVRSSAVAERLAVAPGDAVASIRRLHTQGLIRSLDSATYDSTGVPERVVTALTPKGWDAL